MRSISHQAPIFLLSQLFEEAETVTEKLFALWAHVQVG